MAVVSVVLGGAVIAWPGLVGQQEDWTVSAVVLWTIVVTSAASSCMGQMALPASFVLMRLSRSFLAMPANMAYSGASLLSVVAATSMMASDAAVAMYSVMLLLAVAWRTRRVNQIAVQQMGEGIMSPVGNMKKRSSHD
jgi:hypothetical protein